MYVPCVQECETQQEIRIKQNKIYAFFQITEIISKHSLTMQSTVCTLVVLVRYSNLHLYHVFPAGEKLYCTCLCVYINLIKCYKFVCKVVCKQKANLSNKKFDIIFLIFAHQGYTKTLHSVKNTLDLPTVCTQGSEGYSKNGDAISWRTDWSKASDFLFFLSLFCELNLL